MEILPTEENAGKPAVLSMPFMLYQPNDWHALVSEISGNDTIFYPRVWFISFSLQIIKMRHLGAGWYKKTR